MRLTEADSQLRMRKPAAYSAPLPSEDDLQALVEDYCRVKGWIALSTVHRTKLADCPKCHSRFRPRGGYGASPGVPDLLLRLPHWSQFVFCGVELKKHDKAAVRPAQAVLAASGAVAICWTLEMVIETVMSVDRRIQGIEL